MDGMVPKAKALLDAETTTMSDIRQSIVTSMLAALRKTELLASGIWYPKWKLSMLTESGTAAKRHPDPHLPFVIFRTAVVPHGPK